MSDHVYEDLAFDLITLPELESLIPELEQSEQASLVASMAAEVKVWLSRRIKAHHRERVAPAVRMLLDPYFHMAFEYSRMLVKYGEGNLLTTLSKRRMDEMARALRVLGATSEDLAKMERSALDAAKRAEAEAQAEGGGQ